MNEENEELQERITEMSLVIGMLRGMIIGVEFTEAKKEMLERIDKTIKRLFYSEK